MSTTDFYTYFEHVNESCSKNAEALPAGQQYEYKILKCDENESIDIPDGAYITGAYWGDPKQFKKGKDITKKVVAFVREKNFKTIFGNTEWFGGIDIHHVFFRRHTLRIWPMADLLGLVSLTSS